MPIWGPSAHGGGPAGGGAESHPPVLHHQPDQGDQLERPRIAPQGVSFNHFGTSEPSYCEFYVHVQGKAFVAVNSGKPFCMDVPANLK